MKISLTKLITMFVCCSLLIGGLGVTAAESTKEAIKTAYVYNFLRYIIWPDHAEKSVLKLSYFGSNSNYLNTIKELENKSIHGHRIEVKQVLRVKDVLSSDIILVDPKNNPFLRQINAMISDSPVLVLTEGVKEKQLFGINFIMEKANHIGFEINRYNLVYQKLEVSPDIIILGGTEIEIASMIKKMEADLEKSRTQLTDVLAQVEIKQKLLDAQSSQIQTQQQRLSNLNDTIKKEQSDFQRLNKEYTELTDSLAKSRKEITLNNQLLENKQDELKVKSVAIVDLANLIETNKQLLIEQTAALNKQRQNLFMSEQQLEKQTQALLDQELILEQQVTTIEIQSMAIYAAIVLILSVIISIAMVYRGNRLKQKINLKLENKNKELVEVNKQLTEMQGQLVESEKMAALGGLVAGVAHEINTPIGVSVTSASHLQDSVLRFKKIFDKGNLKRSELEQLLENLTESGEILNRNLKRAADLISSFKKVSTDQTNEEIRSFNLNDYLNEICLNLYHKLKQKKHHIKIDCPTDVSIKSYPGALAQVMTNLIINSISHGFGANMNGQITIRVVVKEKQFELHYQDDGKGISVDERGKVFDPFYTTNRSNGGTGLGMNICYNLASQKLRGSIHCLESFSGAYFLIRHPLEVTA